MKSFLSLLLCLFLLIAYIPALSGCNDGDPSLQSVQNEQETQQVEDEYYILNTATKKYHRTDCSYLPSPENSKKVRRLAKNAYYGYSPCQHCDP